MKKKFFIYLAPDIYSLAYLVHRSSLKDHALITTGHSWKIVSSPYCPGPELHALQESENEIKKNNDDYNKKDNCVPWQCDDCSGMDSTDVKKWLCINNVESMMQINHLTNLYHAYVYLKSSLLHFSCSIVSKFCFVFFSARLIGKKLAFAKWDKCMERSSLQCCKLILPKKAFQFQQHELDWSLQQVG